MNHDSWLTERFEANRLRLRGLAYRMLGSLGETEDEAGGESQLSACGAL